MHNVPKVNYFSSINHDYIWKVLCSNHIRDIDWGFYVVLGLIVRLWK
jgi:hypothetical protein